MGRRALLANQVLQIMRRHARHCWTLDELQEDLRRRGMTPDPSSVFRAVCGLAQAGEVVRVPIDHGRGHYEVAAGHHEHLICGTCGRVEPLACAIVDALAEQVRHSSGFAVSGHQLVLTGTCAGCAPAGPVAVPAGPVAAGPVAVLAGPVAAGPVVDPALADHASAR
ncbi:MAG: transcriptional repressor [Actinomycetota bacterium]|nr:transcriptional repressor [Actinomycetota bacterium]